ncbi:MAG: sulfotransferase family 2 domain-containing protein [Hyphomonas sp.]|nr:sulfotransferase family 2 domain-containing protein [Hyphomonas sp.]
MPASRMWFHLHIPKTAGSSLNAMLSEAFGEEFQNHQQVENSETARIKSGHRTFRQVPSDHQVFAILRDPTSRLRSEIQHHYGRRGEARYHKLGHLFASMIRDGFEPDEYTLRHPAVMAQCDNLLVRYLCSSPVCGAVTEDHLDEAKANVLTLDCVLFNESFAEDTARLFEQLGAPCPEVRADNKRRTEPIFDELPRELEPFVHFDRQLYDYAIRERDR